MDLDNYPQKSRLSHGVASFTKGLYLELRVYGFAISIAVDYALLQRLAFMSRLLRRTFHLS